MQTLSPLIRVKALRESQAERALALQIEVHARAAQATCDAASAHQQCAAAAILREQALYAQVYQSVVTEAELAAVMHKVAQARAEVQVLRDRWLQCQAQEAQELQTLQRCRQARAQAWRDLIAMKEVAQTLSQEEDLLLQRKEEVALEPIGAHARNFANGLSDTLEGQVLPC
jgi:hypothetical protein